MGVETLTALTIGSLVAGAASSGYSIYANERQNKKNKKLQRSAQALLNDEEQKAQNRRRELLDQQREQLESIYGGSYHINQTSESGLNHNLLG